MTIDIATRQPEALPEAVERVLLDGDLSKLTTEQRLRFYLARCEAAGLDPRGRPFEYMQLSGKLVLYAKKECAEQLNGLHGISHTMSGIIMDEKTGLIEVMVQASMRGGRTTVDIGIVDARGLTGEKLANAKMKAVTKAKRRATLSLCGMGDVMDESELDTVPDARPCSESGAPTPPKNDSGHGRGQYASDEQAQLFNAARDKYIDQRNLKWLDRWTDEHTGEFPSGAKQFLVNPWQADNHLVKWCCETGRLDPASLPEDGSVKSRQIGYYTAVVYHRSPAERKAIAKELERYIDQQEERATDALRKAHPELFDDAERDAGDDDDFEPGGDI